MNETAPEPASLTVTHRSRANIFAREAEWRVDDDRLFWRALDSEDHGMMSLDNVASVRLTVEPGRTGPRRLLRVRSRSGALLLLSSAHVGAWGRQENRSDTFAPLTRAIVTRAAALSPGARFEVGATPLAWYGVAAGLASFLAALGLMLARYGSEMLTGRLLLGGALVLLGLPNLLRWLASNKPGTFDPANPPLG